MNGWKIAGCTLLLASMLAACAAKSSDTGKQSTALKPQSPEDEKAISLYKDNCMTCHGDQLQGRIGPNLQHIGGKLAQDQIVARIQNGGGGMPTFAKTLKPDEIQALAVWLESHK